MREGFKKVQRTILLICFVVLFAPVSSSAQEINLSRVIEKVRSLLSFSPTGADQEADQKVDTGRRRFLQIFGATAAVAAADPHFLIQAATGNANTLGLAEHEIYSLIKMRSLMPFETLRRLKWATDLGLPAGSFSTVDLVRLGRFRMSAQTFTQFATTSAGRTFGTQLVSSADLFINSAFADVSASIRAARAAPAAQAVNQQKPATQQAGASAQPAPGPGVTVSASEPSIVGTLGLAELIPADLHRRLQWAAKFQTKVELNHQETIGFLFYTAAASLASESVNISSEERAMYQSMSNFAQSMLPRIQTETEARKMLRSAFTMEQLETEPELDGVRHTIRKMGMAGHFAPVCHAIYKIRLEN